MFELKHKLEALLFYTGEPQSRARLQKLLGCSEDELVTVQQELRGDLATRGIRLLVVGDELELVTAPESSDLITAIRKDELSRDLGKAGAETLSIVLYRGPATRAEIEYIRGVNSSFVLRNLMVRGLVDRVPHPEKARSVVYQPTAELLAHLGITAVEELPEYEATRAALSSFEAERLGEEEATEAHGASDAQSGHTVESTSQS